jgi:hypothetical protein
MRKAAQAIEGLPGIAEAAKLLFIFPKAVNYLCKKHGPSTVALSLDISRKELWNWRHQGRTPCHPLHFLTVIAWYERETNDQMVSGGLNTSPLNN